MYKHAMKAHAQLYAQLAPIGREAYTTLPQPAEPVRSYKGHMSNFCVSVAPHKVRAKVVATQQV